MKVKLLKKVRSKIIVQYQREIKTYRLYSYGVCILSSTNKEVIKNRYEKIILDTARSLFNRDLKTVKYPRL
jgi:hypothetical protein